jgi:hypothetical protein
MKITERKSMWHHAVFSVVLCIAMVAIVFIQRDVPALIVAAFIAVYVAGNTLLHYLHKDFRKETLYEYLLVSAAVLFVLLGAIRH